MATCVATSRVATSRSALAGGPSRGASGGNRSPPGSQSARSFSVRTNGREPAAKPWRAARSSWFALTDGYQRANRPTRGNQHGNHRISLFEIPQQSKARTRLSARKHLPKSDDCALSGCRSMEHNTASGLAPESGLSCALSAGYCRATALFIGGKNSVPINQPAHIALSGCGLMFGEM